MFANIEHLVRGTLNSLTIQEERYGKNLLMGIDHEIFSKRPVYDLIDAATGPGDCKATDAYDVLSVFEEKHPAFLFVKAKNLAEGLEILEAKAGVWLSLSEYQRDMVIFELIKIVYPNENWAEAEWFTDPSRYDEQ